MKTAEIKRRFLAHFEANGHTVVPSRSAARHRRPEPAVRQRRHGAVRAVLPGAARRRRTSGRSSVQKCIRTPDIDEVGKTSRHGTFFQMNGNFSFGDYFKAGAIPLAWELVTKPVDRGRLRAGPGADLGDGLPRRRRGVRDLAADRRCRAERIVRRGKKDNFWSMGIPGPCGPCSELYYDRGPEYGREGGPEVDEDRYMEFWNLVFMQYETGTGQRQGGLPDPR